MTRFWWVRHGPTHRKELIGWSDVPADLSDTVAVNRLRSHLPKQAEIMSSDLLRCRQTAAAIFPDHAGIPHHSALREIHFGDWEEQTFASLSGAHPELAEEFWTTPGDVALHGGESWNQMSARVHDHVTQLCGTDSDRDIIIVAHFGVILSQIQRAAGMSAQSAIGFSIDNLSVTRIDHLGGLDWRIAGVNHIP